MGPSVRVQIADLGQAFGNAIRVLQAGREEQIMHFAHFAVPLVNGTYFSLEAKQRRRAALMSPGLRAAEKIQLLGLHIQAVQSAGLVENQLLAQLGPPLRMGEIPGAQHVDALAARPGGQVPED